MSATMYDRLTLLPVLSLVIGKVLVAGITGPFRGDDEAKTMGEYLMGTVFRNLMTKLTYGQLQMIMPPFLSSYEAWCKKQKIQPVVVDIPDTSIKGFWMGDKNSAKYVMVYYHGGGFVMPGLPQHVDFLSNMLKWTNGKLAIFCPCYTLAPHGVYPLQLAESVESLRYVLNLPNRSPSDVLLGGDSAGGNLVLAVLSHISQHPHPQSNIVKPLQVSGPLKGALTIAPWVSSDTSKFKSMTEFAHIDVVNSICANYWFDLYKGHGKQVANEEYLVPEIAAPTWWAGMKVSTMLSTAGDKEVLRDGIVSWAKKYQAGAGQDKLKLVVAEGEIHDHPLTPKAESELEKLGDLSQEGAIRNWLKSQLT